MRNATSINGDLGANPLPNGLVSVPIPTFLEPNIQDDISYDGCNWAITTTDERYPVQETFKDFWWIANFAKGPVGAALGIPEEELATASFRDVYHYQDAYVAREFENLPFYPHHFTENTYLEMRTT